jgi:choice-of-anchor B domain-containing protein
MKRVATIILSLLFFSVSFAQLNVSELGRFTYTVPSSDIWGYADENGNEYALVGVLNGFSVVDVTDPANLSEVFFEQGVPSIWRDVKTWDNHAYVSTEGGNGILIVDLNPLPGTITSTSLYTGSQYPFTTVHNIYIDEFGRLYIFGANNGSGGAIICDLTADPMNPVELGQFDAEYFHDGMARGDTLWGAAIYAGLLMAIDVSDPANPTIMGTASTPNQFAHNAWVSDDGTHVFTTDEVSGAFVAAYNVTELDDIYETDRVQSSPGSLVIPHNVHVYNDYLVTSYYTDGVTIHDANRPHNLVEVGNYDTSPNFEGGGFDGCWGVYPYLPSGNIIASDIQEGLYVLEPDYKRACYVEGMVTDSATGFALGNVTIRLLGTDNSAESNLDGSYAFGTVTSGTYDVEFSHPEYPSLIIEGVELENGVLTELNVEMSSWFTSIDERYVSDNVDVYPNPFGETVTVSYQLERTLSSSATLRVFDINGRLVEDVPLENTQSTVSVGNDLPGGIYFVRIVNGSEITRTKRISKL